MLPFSFRPDRDVVSVVIGLVACLSLPAVALTKYDIMGDYTLLEFRNYYPTYGVLIETNDLVGLSGRASLSGQVGTLEMSAYYQGSFYWRWATGFYTLSGNQGTFSIVGEGSETVTFEVPSDDIVIVSGASYDPYGDYYTYRYVFQRTGRYYDEAQLATEIDDAVASAMSGLYTQEQVDAAVANALAAVKPKVVPIIMID